MNRERAYLAFSRGSLAFIGQLAGAFLLALFTAFLLETAAFAGSRVAEFLLTPFGLVGFVFGNVHQGDEHISHVALVLFLIPCYFVVLRALTYWAARRRAGHPL